MEEVAGKTNFNVWDIGGDTSIRPYWKLFFRSMNALGVIFMIRIEDFHRFEEGIYNLLIYDKLEKHYTQR